MMLLPLSEQHDVVFLAYIAKALRWCSMKCLAPTPMSAMLIVPSSLMSKAEFQNGFSGILMRFLAMRLISLMSTFESGVRYSSPVMPICGFHSGPPAVV